MDLLGLWWVWGLGAIVLLGLEILVPAFLFLGFGLGAASVALLVGLGVLQANPALLALAFAVLSLIAWIAVRHLGGARRGQVKTWDTDINDV